jgi:hypothetical protein
MLRGNATPDLSASESATGQLLAMVPDTAGLYRAWARPTPERVEQWVSRKLLARSSPAPRRSNDAPDVPESVVLGEEADLEVRIDQAPLLDDRTSAANEGLRKLFAASTIDAMLEVSSTAVDAEQVFVRSHSALVLLAREPWNADAVRSALSDAASVWTQAALGATWKPAVVGQELSGLGKIILAIDGTRLIVGDSPDLVAAIVARRNQATVAGAIYSAGFRQVRELPNFERLMRLIDFPEIRAREPANGAREPMFYSENLASFGRVLGRVEQVSVASHDSGVAVRELAAYRLAP